VVDSKGQLTLNRDWKLATNPKTILDVSIGVTNFGEGVFVLYTGTGGTSEIQFMPFRSDKEANLGFVVQPVCPPGEFEILYRV